MKYSPSDSTVVAALSYDSSYIQLSVRDEGFGIALPDQEKLFEKFFRSSSQDEEGPGGSGLGLAIVKEIVEQHSGQVTVESELGEGSIFRVRLPLV